MESSKQIADYLIIGAGLAGLSAAIRLHHAGKNVLVLESADKPGGRIRTDHHEGFLLDRGFQVYLDAYSEGKRILDLKALQLKAFDPGAILLLPGGRSSSFTDPMRSLSGWTNIWGAKLGSLEDKMHLFSLKSRLLNQRNSSIFQKKDYATSKVLDRYSYSPTAQKNFFRPFFSGIFLEKELNTNRKMFDFVFKMFSAGSATLPSEGMEAIPAQMSKRLPPESMLYNKKVNQLDGNKVHCSDGSSYEAKTLIIAAPPGAIPGLKIREIYQKPWNGVTTLYFSAPKAPYKQKMLALNTREIALCNHLAVLSNVAPTYAPQGKALLSANIIGVQDTPDDELIQAVREELSEWYGEQTKQWQHLRTYRVPYALPNQESVAYDLDLQEAKLSENLYQCGDFLLNGSIQAAMRSGRQLAEFLLKD